MSTQRQPNSAKCDENKKALINFFCIMRHNNYSLKSICRKCPCTHEEADVIIISYLLELIHQGCTKVATTCKCWLMTQTFLYWYCSSSGTRCAPLTMRNIRVWLLISRQVGREMSGVDLLATHALSGYDSIP